MKPNQRKMIRGIKKLTISLVLLVVVFGGFGVSFAKDGVGVKVEVLQRKSTDTTNDFVMPSVIEPQVLGSSIDTTQMCLRGESDTKPIPIWQKIINLFHI